MKKEILDHINVRFDRTVGRIEK